MSNKRTSVGETSQMTVKPQRFTVGRTHPGRVGLTPAGPAQADGSRSLSRRSNTKGGVDKRREHLTRDELDQGFVCLSGTVLASDDFTGRLKSSAVH